MSTFLLPESPVTSLDEYLAGDTGGLGLQRAQAIGPAATIEEISRAGLRGRGGGGFPTGRKWASIVNQPGSHATSSAMEPRASRERSRTGRSCGPTPISWWKAC